MGSAANSQGSRRFHHRDIPWRRALRCSPALRSPRLRRSTSRASPGRLHAIDADHLHTKTGPILSNGGSILVTGGGNIGGGAEGVFAKNCSITTLLNNGSIGAATGAPRGAGGIGVLTNSGRTINLLNNAAGAMISGGKGGGASFGSAGGPGGAGAWNSGTITTLTNSGTIRGGRGGFASGVGGSGGAGVSNSGTITRLSNSGAIVDGHGGNGFFGAARAARAS